MEARVWRVCSSFCQVESKRWISEAGHVFSTHIPDDLRTTRLLWISIDKASALLVIGQSDRTVVGKGKVKKELLSVVGQYPELGRRTAKLITNSALIELPDVGHIPHLEAPELFHKELLKFLKANWTNYPCPLGKAWSKNVTRWGLKSLIVW